MRHGICIDLRYCGGCGGCVMACKVENGPLAGIYWCNLFTKEIGKYPAVRKMFLPAACMHCQDAPCVTHCPTGASYHDKDGAVLINLNKCIGCRGCVNACPYNARHYNFAHAEKNPYYKGQEMTPFEKVKEHLHPVGKTGKCNMCRDRIEDGKIPACVETCFTKARYFGDLDDPKSEISQVIAMYNAKPLHEELGTKPSVYYIGDF